MYAPIALRLVLLWPLAAAACRAPEAAVLVFDDAVKVAADGRILSLVPLPGYAGRNPAWNGRSITLAGARAETVAFQIVIQAGAAPLGAVDVQASDLVREDGARIDAARLTRFREWYLPVTIPSTSPGGSAGPGEYPDALVPASAPRHGLPVDVAARRSQGVWIDCEIPRDSGPGTYRGHVSVKSGTKPLARLPVELTVHPFTLPPERHLRWRVGYSDWETMPARLGVPEESAEWLRLEADLYRLFWEGHRVAPTTHYHDLRLDSRGRGDALQIDWTRFDRRFGPYLDGSAFADGVPLNVFSLPINLHCGWPSGVEVDPATAIEPRPGRRYDPATLTAAARLVARHWDERGWRLGDAFVYVADEPGPERWGAVKQACAAIRRGDPRIRTSAAFYTEFGRDAPGVVRAFTGAVTAWDVAGDHLDLPALRERQAAGDAVGMYQGGEPFEGGEALDDDGLALTTWPWIAWRYGLDGLYLYNATEWTYFRLDAVKGVPWAGARREIWENPLNQSWATNGQGVLVYPGPYVGLRGVVPSIRLKQARRGLQDYEYLWLAAQRGHRTLADAAARRLVPRALHEAGPLGVLGARGPWERDPRAWDATRRELARAIAAPASAEGR